ncbi:hypothetical protein OG558_22335 [Kribbella sp. NBC_01510]|uniref:hypothetical protein n=1 Tax=Kribbella sp. NBC_01510 TaxID=2903581 RepID=UPI003866B421
MQRFDCTQQAAQVSLLHLDLLRVVEPPVGCLGLGGVGPTVGDQFQVGLDLGCQFIQRRPALVVRQLSIRVHRLAPSAWLRPTLIPTQRVNGVIEFPLTVLTHDVLSPAIGQHRLANHYKEVPPTR